MKYPESRVPCLKERRKLETREKCCDVWPVNDVGHDLRPEVGSKHQLTTSDKVRYAPKFDVHPYLCGYLSGLLTIVKPMQYSLGHRSEVMYCEKWFYRGFRRRTTI